MLDADISMLFHACVWTVLLLVVMVKVVLLLLPLWSSVSVCWLHENYKNMCSNSLLRFWAEPGLDPWISPRAI
jgi:hypothetical protein